jgi:hypothetical protein
VRDTSGDSLADALRQAAASLRRARAPYAIIGACALAVWGQPRTTLDLDLLVLVDADDLGKLSNGLVATGMQVDEVWRDWNPMLRESQVRLRFRDVTVDLLRPRDAHDEAAVRRRCRRRLGGRYYWLVGPEDFVLQKIKVGRPRDFEDALSVMTRHGGALDRRYLRTWAQRLGVREELAYVERGLAT